MKVELNSLPENTEKSISSDSCTSDPEKCSIQNSNQRERKKRCRLKALGCFKTCFLILAIAGLAVVMILHSIKLDRRIHYLEKQVSEMAAGNVSEIQGHLQDLDASLAKEMAARNVSEMRSQLQGLQASLDTLNSSLNTLNNSLNRSLRQRFAGCRKERRLCTLNPVQDDRYYRACLTPTIPDTRSVSIWAEPHPETRGLVPYFLWTCKDYSGFVNPCKRFAMKFAHVQTLKPHVCTNFVAIFFCKYPETAVRPCH